MVKNHTPAFATEEVNEIHIVSLVESEEPVAFLSLLRPSIVEIVLLLVLSCAATEPTELRIHN